MQMSLPVKAKPQTKFICVFNLPSGAKMAAGAIDEHFALIPITNKVMKGVMAWDTPKEVAEWLKGFKKKVGPEEWPKWAALRPGLGKIVIAN